MRLQRRRRFLTIKDDLDDGMLKAFAAFDTVSGTQFKALLSDIATKLRTANRGRGVRRSWSQYMMQALLVATGLEPASPTLP